MLQKWDYTKLGVHIDVQDWVSSNSTRSALFDSNKGCEVLLPCSEREWKIRPSHTWPGRDQYFSQKSKVVEQNFVRFQSNSRFLGSCSHL